MAPLANLIKAWNFLANQKEASIKKPAWRITIRHERKFILVTVIFATNAVYWNTNRCPFGLSRLMTSPSYNVIT